MFKKILINASWLTFGQAATRIFKFLLVVFAVRMLHIDGYGTFAYAIAYVSLFFIIVSLLHTLSPLQRDMAAEPERVPAMLGKHLPWRFWIVGLTALVAIGCSFFFPNLPLMLVTILSISLGIDFLRDLFGTALQAGEHMKQEGLSVMGQSIGACVAAVALLAFFPTSVALALAYLAGSLIGGIITISYFAKRHSMKDLRMSLQQPAMIFVKEYVPLSFGVGIAWMLAVTLLIQFATFVAGVFLSAATVGIISILLTLVQIAVVPYSMLGSSLIPVMVRSVSQDIEAFIIGGTIFSLGCISAIAVPLIPFITSIFLPAEWIPIVYLMLIMSVIGCFFAVCFYIFVARHKKTSVVLPSLYIAILGAVAVVLSLSKHSVTSLFIVFIFIYAAFAAIFYRMVLKRAKGLAQVQTDLLQQIVYLFAIVGGIMIALLAKNIIIATLLIVICSGMLFAKMMNSIKNINNQSV